jgi:hypothetical protein
MTDVPPDAKMGHPFVHLRKRDGEVVCEGRAHYLGGRKIPPAEGDRPDGCYLEWSWDGASLTVESAPWGFVPCYYFATRDEICVSTRIDVVLARRGAATLDDTAIAVFLRLGFFLGDDTPFSGVYAAPRSGRFAWRPGAGLEIAPAEAPPQPEETTLEAAIEEYGDRFADAVRRRLPAADTVLPLSGGRDSRHILLELDRQGAPPREALSALLFPPRNDEDTLVAARLAAAVGVPFRTVAQPRWPLRSWLEKNRFTSYCSDEHHWVIALSDAIVTGVPGVWDGIAGDNLSESRFPNQETQKLYRRRDTAEVARRIIRRWSGVEEAVTAALSPTARARFALEKAQGRLEAELAQYVDGPNPLGSFYLFNRTRREIALSPFAILGRCGPPLCPYLDRAVSSYLRRMPADFLARERLHSATIAARYPRYASIPYAGEAPARPDPGHWRRLSAQLLGVLAPRARSPQIRGAWVLSRLARGLLLGREDVLWWHPLLVQWLTEVDSFAPSGRSALNLEEHGTMSSKWIR